jgi:hypothetical protein
MEVRMRIFNPKWQIGIILFFIPVSCQRESAEKPIPVFEKIQKIVRESAYPESYFIHQLKNKIEPDQY